MATATAHRNAEMVAQVVARHGTEHYDYAVMMRGRDSKHIGLDGSETKIRDEAAAVRDAYAEHDGLLKRSIDKSLRAANTLGKLAMDVGWPIAVAGAIAGVATVVATGGVGTFAMGLLLGAAATPNLAMPIAVTSIGFNLWVGGVWTSFIASKLHWLAIRRSETHGMASNEFSDPERVALRH